jgi:hypothetical protein
MSYSGEEPAHDALPNVSIGPSGVFESRIAVACGRWAATTHSVVLAPLYDDLNQRRGLGE